MQVAPWSKTGGLGDVCSSLPIALAARGHRVMVVTPRYKPYEPELIKDTGVGREDVQGKREEVVYRPKGRFTGWMPFGNLLWLDK